MSSSSWMIMGGGPISSSYSNRRSRILNLQSSSQFNRHLINCKRPHRSSYGGLSAVRHNHMFSGGGVGGGGAFGGGRGGGGGRRIHVSSGGGDDELNEQQREVLMKRAVIKARALAGSVLLQLSLPFIFNYLVWLWLTKGGGKRFKMPPLQDLICDDEQEDSWLSKRAPSS